MGAEEAIRAAQADLAALPNRDVEALRRIRKKVSKRLAPLAPDVVRDVGLAVWRDGPRWVAYELLAGHETALAAMSCAEIEAFGEGMSSWDEADSFGVLLGGAAWQAGVVGDHDVMRWAKSDDVWWRRAALVSTVTLNTKSRGGTGETERTLAVCAWLADDREEMVVKALSWALRSLAAWDPEAVAAFVEEHDGVLAARVKREVRNKLKTGLKSGRSAAKREGETSGKRRRRS